MFFRLKKNPNKTRISSCFVRDHFSVASITSCFCPLVFQDPRHKCFCQPSHAKGPLGILEKAFGKTENELQKNMQMFLPRNVKKQEQVFRLGLCLFQEVWMLNASDPCAWLVLMLSVTHFHIQEDLLNKRTSNVQLYLSALAQCARWFQRFH